MRHCHRLVAFMHADPLHLDPSEGSAALASVDAPRTRRSFARLGLVLHADDDAADLALVLELPARLERHRAVAHLHLPTAERGVARAQNVAEPAEGDCGGAGEEVVQSYGDPAARQILVRVAGQSNIWTLKYGSDGGPVTVGARTGKPPAPPVVLQPGGGPEEVAAPLDRPIETMVPRRAAGSDHPVQDVAGRTPRRPARLPWRRGRGGHRARRPRREPLVLRDSP